MRSCISEKQDTLKYYSTLVILSKNLQHEVDAHFRLQRSGNRGGVRLEGGPPAATTQALRFFSVVALQTMRRSGEWVENLLIEEETNLS